MSWWLPCWVSRGYLDSFRQHTKLSPTFSPYSTPIRWVLVRLVFYPFKEFRLRYSQKFLLWSGDICYDNYKIRHTMIKLRKKKKKREKYFLLLFCHSRNLRGYMVWVTELTSLYSKLLKQKLKRKQTKKTKPLFYLTWIAYCLKKWHWKRVPLSFKGFLIFILHCVRNGQVSLILKE